MAYRPRIGLTMRLELETQRFYLGREYSEAVEAAGGVPVHLPLIAKEEFIQAALEGLDGILLPGSDTDVDPKYFGEQPHRGLGKVVPEKDETDLLVLREVERRNIPLMAICYGIQVLNVSRGGTLIQDIGAQVENCLKHDQGRPLARGSHDLKLDRDGLLFEFAKRSNFKDTVRVNSHHHQAIRETGANLRATAWANDGVIEGIEDTRPDRFVIGVQWHPELSWNTDEFSRAIFQEFVAQCSGKAENLLAARPLETLVTS